MNWLSTSIKRVYFVRLKTGDDVINSLTTFCKENDVVSGVIFGLGATQTALLGYFDVQTKRYKPNRFDFYAEIINAIGNVTKTEDGEVLVHLHMAIGDSNGNVFGGHVLPGTIISVTGEFIILETELSPSRKLDSTFNLKLWS